MIDDFTKGMAQIGHPNMEETQAQGRAWSFKKEKESLVFCSPSVLASQLLKISTSTLSRCKCHQHFIQAREFKKLHAIVRCRVTRLGDFLPIRQLFVGSLKQKAPKMSISLATNLLHFHWIRYLKASFVIWHDLPWLLFWLLFKILGGFFQNHLVTLGCHSLFCW